MGALGILELNRLSQRIKYSGQFKDRTPFGNGPDAYPENVRSYGEYDAQRGDIEQLVGLMEETMPMHWDGTYYACEVGSLVWKRAVARRILAGLGIRP